MKTNKLILTMLLGISLSACGQKSDAHPNQDEAVSKRILINGKLPEDYYAQFILRAEPCIEKDYHYYYFLSSRIGVLKSDKKFTFSARIYLLADHTYIAELTQMVPSDRWEGTHIHVKKFEQHGRWEVDETQIVLENLGRGMPLKYNGSDGFYMTFDKVDASEVFNGSEAFVNGAHSTSVLQKLEMSCE